MKRRALVTAVMLGGLTGGCNVGPNYHAPHPAVYSSWSETGRPAATNPATQPSTPTTRPVQVTEWWTTFNDPTLDELVDKAERQNLDLIQAESRIRAARQQRIIAGAAEFPTLDAEGGYLDGRGSKNVSFPIGALIPSSSSGGKSSSKSLHGQPGVVRPGQVRIHPNQVSSSSGQQSGGGAISAGSAGGGSLGGGTENFGSGSSGVNLAPGGPKSPLGGGGLPGIETQLFEAGFDASYEIDIFGGTRRSVEAANAEYSAAIWDARDVLVTLLAEVARNYIELRGYQRELFIARQNLASQEHTLDLTRQQFRAGLTTQLDVAQELAQVATTRAQIPAFEAMARQSIHQLSELLGEEPDALAEELALPKAIPPAPAEIPLGLPADLLRRRPDIRRAERQIAVAVARVGVATADLFPKFTITSSFGMDSSNIAHLVDWPSRYFLISPGVSWPIFEGGKIVANIDFQKEGEFEAMVTYRQTVLTAFQEVEDALAAFDGEQARRASLAEAVAANQQAVDLANQQYTQGVVNFLNVLDAQRALFESQDDLAQSDRDLDSDLIALYKAMGGGWQVAAADR